VQIALSKRIPTGIALWLLPSAWSGFHQSAGSAELLRNGPVVRLEPCNAMNSLGSGRVIHAKFG
jgi:hypothetical protein